MCRPCRSRRGSEILAAIVASVAGVFPVVALTPVALSGGMQGFAGSLLLPATAAAAQEAAPVEPTQAERQPAELQARVRQLIEELGAEDFATREAAERELIRIGGPAYEPLLEALNHPDPEVVARVRYLLRVIPTQLEDVDNPTVRELLGYYDSGAPEVRRKVLRLLAHLGHGRGWGPLARLVRFERDPLWARVAAVELIAAQPVPEDLRAKYATAVRRVLGETVRAPASWPLVYISIFEQQADALQRWRQIVAEEQKVLVGQPGRTSPTIVAALWAFQAVAEHTLGQTEAAQGSFARMQELLLPEVAEHLQTMVDLAVHFHHLGLNAWAEAELRRAVAGAEPRRGLLPRRALAEFLFDQGQPLAAAQVLEPFFKLLQERQLPLLDSETFSPGEVRSRMYYFFACHWKEQGDLNQSGQNLELALRYDPQNLDALIARWELATLSPEDRQETATLIARARKQLERYAAESRDPEDQASYFNQLAWLIGNTKLDLDQALKWAQKAVELHPENSAYWDTLAHVYFHRGELERAVEAQSRAVALQPGSGFLRRQLERFKRALEEKQNPGG